MPKPDKDAPLPMIPLIPDDPTNDLTGEPSAINRVTLRYLSIRERGGEAYQDFPQNEYVGSEVAITHRQAAYIIPDMELGPEPKLLNLGWIDDPRLVVILNRTVWKGVTKPSKDQQKTIAGCVVLIGFASDSFPIRLEPKQQQPLLLSPGGKIYVRAESGSPIISVFAV